MPGPVTSDAALPADAPVPSAVLDAFGLDGEVLGVEPVPGGWSNRVLHLRTTSGGYAVKQVRNPWGVEGWRGWLAEGWRVEQEAIAAGIAAPEPVAAVDGGCVLDVRALDGSLVPVRVHRWVEGARPVPREPVDETLAAWVGESLGTMQGLALRPLDPTVYADRLGLTTADVWPDLVARAVAAGAPWAAALADAEPLARRASALLRPWDESQAVLVHGDLDQKNLLLGPGGPLLCDWDVVLPLEPQHELAAAAATMADWRDPRPARAVLRGWARASQREPEPAPYQLGPALASRLGWIRFQVDRGLAGQERDLQLEPLLDELARRVRVAESWPDWVGAGPFLARRS